MKRIVASIEANFDKNNLYSGDDISTFLEMLQEFVEKENKGFPFASFKFKSKFLEDKKITKNYEILSNLLSNIP